MDDPWDVKSVRQLGQYTSCMKLNGTPLLPPVLSKECRREMQYYKLLAKEVEKRICILQPYVTDSDTESTELKTDAPEVLESEQNYELAREHVDAAFDLTIDNVTARAKQKHIDTEFPTNDAFSLPTSNIVANAEAPTSKLVIDFSLSINQENGRNVVETFKSKPSPGIELPERDYGCVETKEMLFKVETNNKQKKQNKTNVVKDPCEYNQSVCKYNVTNPFIESSTGPSSISSKAFTGSLDDLYVDSVKGAPHPTKLIRQSSYKLLTPSPQLLAHLEVQSLNTGIEMSSISMSESLSNLSISNKKRRSWDLESAKVKWSSMAMELKAKQLTNSNTAGNKKELKPAAKNTNPVVQSSNRAKSVISEKNRNGSTPKPTPKSESFHKKRPSPIRNIPSSNTIVKESASPNPTSPTQRNEPPLKSATPIPLVTESEDPATKVRELYDKIQKQQIAQMASLVEKQKREQMMLQQVFEDQNNLLFKQLKTIVPKSPTEVKEAWAEKSLEDEEDRGPVSLSQLINPKSPEQSRNPISSTLTDTSKYIDKCDNVLKRSRDLSGSMKKPRPTCQNETRRQTQRAQPEGTRTRTHSPARNTPASSPISRNTSRRLNYDTASSCDPILTDRTNDTMADLNITFSTDKSDECESFSNMNTAFNHLYRKDVTVIHENTSPTPTTISVDSAINCIERTIQNSINSSSVRRPKSNTYYQQPTPRELAAAAKIVAFAKGYLVRRLMRTERVTATVQTIRDALLCALQLHQDREGIRGADVDLHRRLIQQITAACYSLHDTFIASSAKERCAVLAADRARRRSQSHRPPPKTNRHSDIMSQSHSGVFPARPKRFSTPSAMTQSTYETYSSDMARRSRYMPSPRHRPWR